MTRLALVNPLCLRDDPVERRLGTPYFPLGLLYLAAVAREAGHTVSIYDAAFSSDDNEFAAFLEREKPQVVGISVLATVRRSAQRLAALARATGATVIVGGADPTSRPEAYLGAPGGTSSSVDVVVCGEGERTLLDLLGALETGSTLEDIPGLAYLDAEKQIVRTSTRPLLAELDELPLPAWDLVDLDPYRRAWRERKGYFSLSLLASRGCPYDCAWCQKSVFGRGLRTRSPESAAEEMRLLKERFQPDALRLVDDVFGVDRDWVRRWHDAVLARDAVIPFECLSRVDLVDDDLARLLHEAGCRRINFGVESGSQRVLDAMNKGINLTQVREARAACRRHGIEAYFYLMLGYPGETWPDIHATISLLAEERPDAFSVTLAYPLPGTAFHKQVRARLLARPDWDYSAENRILFRREFSPAFYRWVQRLLTKEWQAARMRHGKWRPSLLKGMKVRLGLTVSRAAVGVLRRIPPTDDGGQ